MCFHYWSRYTACGHTTYSNSLLCSHGFGILHTKLPVTSLCEAATYRTCDHTSSTEAQSCCSRDSKLFETICQAEKSGLHELLHQKHREGQPVFPCHERRDITTVISDQACPGCKVGLDRLRTKTDQSPRHRDWESVARQDLQSIASPLASSVEEMYGFEPVGVHRQPSGSSSNSEGSWWSTNRLSRSHSGYRSMGTAVESILEVDEEIDRFMLDAIGKTDWADEASECNVVLAKDQSPEEARDAVESLNQVLLPSSTTMVPAEPPLLTLTEAPEESFCGCAGPIEEAPREEAEQAKPSDGESDGEAHASDLDEDFELSFVSAYSSPRSHIKSVSCTQVNLGGDEKLCANATTAASKSCLDLSSFQTLSHVPQTLDGAWGY
ncbi:hypothetical protein BROUX41_003264 [Berkeleyomyces rouxiae]|uniref:uncharacterized protein n=1 Tax=Berkeleyomyces rouxiae TaxID=2035830 RepID=UPI003B78F70E